MRMLISCLSLLLVAAAPPAGFHLKHSGKIYSYEYGWPRDAVAIPALHRLLTREMNRNRRQIVEWATSAFKDAKSDESHFPDVGYESDWTWETVGSTGRLLSLEGDSYQFTGGAHGNPAAMSLLWDRSKGQAIRVEQLFRKPRDYARLRHAYCEALRKDRLEKRGGEPDLHTIPEFDACPKFSDLVVGIVDTNNDGRFDVLRFTANPYLAGPYSEGTYVEDLPVTRDVIASLKPEYRSAFRPQRQ